MSDTHRFTDLDIAKLSQYITTMRYFADKAEVIIQKALVENEVRRLNDEKDI